MLVRAGVVRDQLDVKTRRNLSLDPLEKAQPFAVGVLPLGEVDQLALQMAHGCEQANGAVPDGFMDPRADMPDFKQRGGLDALLLRLTRALLSQEQSTTTLSGEPRRKPIAQNLCSNRLSFQRPNALVQCCLRHWRGRDAWHAGRRDARLGGKRQSLRRCRPGGARPQVVAGRRRRSNSRFSSGIISRVESDPAVQLTANFD